MNQRIQNIIDLIIVLTQKEMKVRYKNSFLGYLWSIAHPLVFALVFFVAFKMVMRIGMENYTIFLITGLFPWQWFSNSVNLSPMLFLENASIIKKINFPRSIIPFTLVLQDMIHFILSIPVIVLFLFIYQESPSLSWFYGIPLLMMIQFMMTFGVSLMVSSVNLFIRDLERLTGILVTLFFYFTPIIYPDTMVPEAYQPFIHLNPLAPLVMNWRSLFLKGTLEPFSLLISFFYALLIFALGYQTYRKLSWRFAEIL